MSVNITGAAWSIWSRPSPITAASKGDPILITSTGHGFSDGDVVWISGATGMTQLNNKAYKVGGKTTDSFKLYRLNGNKVDGGNYGTYSGSSGRVQRCQNNDCSIIVSSASHGLQNDDYVRIDQVAGMVNGNGDSMVNNRTFLVGNVTAGTFTIDPDASTMTPYISGGKAWRANGGGDSFFAFENMDGDLQTHKYSVCVTERTGAQRYTETAPSGASSTSACIIQTSPAHASTIRSCRCPATRPRSRPASTALRPEAERRARSASAGAGTWSPPTGTACGRPVRRPPTIPRKP
jgi:hypothetical protein